MMMEASMDTRNSADLFQRTTSTGVRPALLFLLAVFSLLLMMAAMKPALALPLVAFLAMVGATRHLGRRIFQDLAIASNQSE